jgi:hypothetical protein
MASMNRKTKILRATKNSLLLAFIFARSIVTNGQLVNVPVTGFNNDIVANGVGSNSIPGTTFPSIGMDGAMYTFIDNTFKYSASSTLPTCFMPTSGLAPSLRTAGLTYTFQSYSGFNSMTIDNDNTAYLTSPFSKTGTLILATPASFSKLYVLYESVMYISPMTVDVLVTFADASTQAFNGNSCVNWFTATLPAYNGMGRTQPSGIPQCGGTPNFFPNMFELQLTLSPGNVNKLVQSITFTLPTVYTTGTTADKVNYFHAMAVGGQVAPLAISNVQDVTANFSLFPNPAASEINLVSSTIKANTFLSLYNLAGSETMRIKIESTNQQISLSTFAEGLYFYKISNEEGLLSSGKISHCR